MTDAENHPRFSELNESWLEVFCDGCPTIRFVGQCDVDPGCARCATGIEAEPWNETCVRHSRYKEIDEFQRAIDRAVIGEAV